MKHPFAGWNTQQMREQPYFLKRGIVINEQIQSENVNKSEIVKIEIQKYSKTKFVNVQFPQPNIKKLNPKSVIKNIFVKQPKLHLKNRTFRVDLDGVWEMDKS